MKIRLACSGGRAGGFCHGTVTLSARRRVLSHAHARRRRTKRIAIARVHYRLASGNEKRVTLRLTRAGRMLLEHTRSRRLRIRARATTAGKGRDDDRVVALRRRS